MIAATPGDAIWLREGVFLIKDLYSEKGHGIPAGTFLNKPCRGIFLERKTIKSKSYIKAYVDDVGERLIEEDDVIDMNIKEVS